MSGRVFRIKPSGGGGSAVARGILKSFDQAGMGMSGDSSLASDSALAAGSFATDSDRRESRPLEARGWLAGIVLGVLAAFGLVGFVGMVVGRLQEITTALTLNPAGPMDVVLRNWNIQYIPNWPLVFVLIAVGILSVVVTPRR